MCLGDHLYYKFIFQSVRMDISVSEFLQQLGPEFMKYKQTFMENEFCDSSSLRSMNIEVDLDYMFETNQYH